MTRLGDAELLERLYYGRRLTVAEVADEIGSSPTTVRRHMDKHGIDRRHSAKHLGPAPLRYQKGYEAWATKVDGTQRVVSVHRLLAVAEWGFDAVVGKVVHHKNGIRWDNRVENLELLTASEHNELHAPEPNISECDRCGEQTNHYAHGLCRSCYDTLYNRHRRDGDGHHSEGCRWCSS